MSNESKMSEERIHDESCARLRRVLFVAGLDAAIKFGSLEEQILVLASEFRSRGETFVPVFVSPLGGQAKERFSVAGVETEALALHHFEFAKLRTLLRIIRKHRIEVVHWNFYHPFNAYILALSLLCPRLRHHYTDHTSRVAPQNRRNGAVHRRLRTILFSRYARICCISEYVRESLLEAGAPINRTTVIPYFINTDRFRPAPNSRDNLRKRLDTTTPFVALAVAHLIPEKGIDVALRAIDLLLDSSLWIVGDGPERERLERFVVQMGLEKRVHFAGTQYQVEPFVQAADCLVCPSLWHEAAGLVNIEALACGVPIVASRIGGIPEIVRDNHTGFLVPPGDHKAIAVALHKLFDSHELRTTMGNNARAESLRRYSVSARIADHLQPYRALREG